MNDTLTAELRTLVEQHATRFGFTNIALTLTKCPSLPATRAQAYVFEANCPTCKRRLGAEYRAPVFAIDTGRIKATQIAEWFAVAMRHHHH